MMIKAVRLYIKNEKGKSPSEVNKIKLVKDMGITGDVFAKGGKRQVCIALQKTVNEINKIKNKYACLEKFSCNLVLDGCDIENIHEGDKLKFKTAVLEITSVGRDCHEICKELSCPLINGIIFAEVLQSGVIEQGEEAQL